jgi:hypothetical protein
MGRLQALPQKMLADVSAVGAAVEGRQMRVDHDVPADATRAEFARVSQERQADRGTDAQDLGMADDAGRRGGEGG